jgi:hypothetical protein
MPKRTDLELDKGIKGASDAWLYVVANSLSLQSNQTHCVLLDVTVFV